MPLNLMWVEHITQEGLKSGSWVVYCSDDILLEHPFSTWVSEQYPLAFNSARQVANYLDCPLLVYDREGKLNRIFE